MRHGFRSWQEPGELRYLPGLRPLASVESRRLPTGLGGLRSCWTTLRAHELNRGAGLKPSPDWMFNCPINRRWVAVYEQERVKV